MTKFTRYGAILCLPIAVGIYFLRQYSQGCTFNENAKIEGKVILVTGANTGIGKETVKYLVSNGAYVIMACRNLEKAKQAKYDILNETKIEESHLKVMKLDLSSFSSIRSFSRDFNDHESKLDILINNAGVMWVPYSKSEDGFEMHFAVNHLGHFLLTNLLLDKLKKSSPSRIVTVSSLGHYHGEIDFENLNGEKHYSGTSFYSNSKLMNVLFSRELSKRLSGTGVSTYSLHPGAIMTDLARHVVNPNGIFGTIVYYLLWPFVKSIESGIQTTLHCSLSENSGKETGLYYHDCAVIDPLPIVEDNDLSERFWELSERLTNLKN